MNWKKFVLEVCSDKFEILKWNFGNNYFREKLNVGKGSLGYRYIFKFSPKK